MGGVAEGRRVQDLRVCVDSCRGNVLGERMFSGAANPGLRTAVIFSRCTAIKTRWITRVLVRAKGFSKPLCTGDQISPRQDNNSGARRRGRFVLLIAGLPHDPRSVWAKATIHQLLILAVCQANTDRAAQWRPNRGRDSAERSRCHHVLCRDDESL